MDAFWFRVIIGVCVSVITTTQAFGRGVALTISQQLSQDVLTACDNGGIQMFDGSCFCPPNLSGRWCQTLVCPAADDELCDSYTTVLCVYNLFKYSFCSYRCGMCPGDVGTSSRTPSNTLATTTTPLFATTKIVTTVTVADITTSHSISTITVAATTAATSTATTTAPTVETVSTTTPTSSTATPTTSTTTTTTTPTTSTAATTSTPSQTTHEVTTAPFCIVAPSIPNTDVDLSGNTATYTCKKGFSLRSGINSVSTCQGGIWSPVDLACTDVSNCFIMNDGTRVYSGTQSTTNGGYTCQAWDSQTPNKHPILDSHFSIAAGEDSTPTKAEQENYCRDPSGYRRYPFGRLWCYF